MAPKTSLFFIISTSATLILHLLFLLCQLIILKSNSSVFVVQHAMALDYAPAKNLSKTSVC